MTKKLYKKYFTNSDGKIFANAPSYEACEQLELLFKEEFSEFTLEQIVFYHENYLKLQKIFEFSFYDLFIQSLKNN